MDDPKSVLIITATGRSRDIGAQITLLNELGAAVHLVVLGSEGPLTELVESQGGTASCVEGGPLSRRVGSHAVHRVDECGADLVLCHGQPASLMGLQIQLRRRSVQVVMVRHHADYVWIDGKPRPIIADRVLGLLGRQHIAVSRQVEDQMVRVEGIPRDRVRRMHLGFDWDRDFRSADSERVSEVRDGDPSLLCIARYIPIKRHALLLDAFARIISSWPSARLTLLGRGPLRPKMEERARRLGLEDHVHFAGVVTDVGPWLEAADLLVQVSCSEASPLVIKEAVYHRTPYLTTRVGTAGLYAKDSSLLPVSLDVAHLAEAMNRALAHPALVRVTEAERSRMMELFDIEHQRSVLQEFLERA